jgi:hypothetical protein
MKNEKYEHIVEILGTENVLWHIHSTAKVTTLASIRVSLKVPLAVLVGFLGLKCVSAISNFRKVKGTKLKNNF